MFMLNLAVINKEVRVCSSKLQAQASDSCKEKKIVFFWEKRDAICVIRNKEGYLS